MFTGGRCVYAEAVLHLRDTSAWNRPFIKVEWALGISFCAACHNQLSRSLAVGSLGVATPPTELSAHKSKSSARLQRQHLATLLLCSGIKKWQKKRKRNEALGQPCWVGKPTFWSERSHIPSWRKASVAPVESVWPLGMSSSKTADSRCPPPTDCYQSCSFEQRKNVHQGLFHQQTLENCVVNSTLLSFGQRQSRLGRKIRTILPSRILETLLIIHTHRGLKTSATADTHKRTLHQSPFLSTPFIEVFIKCHRLFTEPYRVKNMNNAEGQILNNSSTAIGKCWFPMTCFLFFLL